MTPPVQGCLQVRLQTLAIEPRSSLQVEVGKPSPLIESVLEMFGESQQPTTLKQTPEPNGDSSPTALISINNYNVRLK